MKTQFYILMSLKTNEGFMNYGQFFFGDDWQAAYDLFRQMKGSEEFMDSALLHIDFMETVNELPIKIRSICCTIEELGANCKLIAKEIFRLNNLEEPL